MTRLYYVGWIVLALVLFSAAFLFVLANPQPLSLSLLVTDVPLQADAGVLVLSVFVVGSLFGLLAGFGLRYLLQLVRGRGR